MTLRSAPGSARRVALDYEIAQEQASALGRLGRALEAALAALAAYDAAASDGVALDGVAPYDHGAAGDATLAEGPKTRARLVLEASHALWCFMVQRESCGLRDPRPVIRDYRVPAEVQNRMGIVIAPQVRRRAKS
jgi:hypothetical protein